MIDERIPFIGKHGAAFIRYHLLGTGLNISATNVLLGDYETELKPYLLKPPSSEWGVKDDIPDFFTMRMLSLAKGDTTFKELLKGFIEEIQAEAEKSYPDASVMILAMQPGGLFMRLKGTE